MIGATRVPCRKRDEADPKADLFFISSSVGWIPEALCDDQKLSPNRVGRLHEHGPLPLAWHCAGETAVQRGPVGSARILVLADDRWAKMLVRGQADALEVLAGVAGGDGRA